MNEFGGKFAGELAKCNKMKPDMYREISLQQSFNELSMEERSCVDRSFSPSRVSLRYNTLSISGELWERVRIFAGRIAETFWRPDFAFYAE